jgi:hypothetical protein
MLSTVTSNRTVTNNVQIGARAKAEAAETGTNGSQDAVQIGLQTGDIPGDIPLSICWGLGSQSAPVVESKPSIADQAPLCETSSAPTSSFDIPGDMPFLVAWGLNKPQPPSFASSPAASAPAIIAQPQFQTPSTSIPTDLSSLDVPGDIPSNILWNLR